MKLTTMDRSNKKLKEAVDIVIIGSGVGGGTFADYVTRGNNHLNVVILEAGPYYDKSYFNQKEIDMTGLYINKGAKLSTNMEIGVAAAKTVGGSSAVYTGVSFRPPKSIIDSWTQNHGIDFLHADYLKHSFDEIEKELSIHELPESWDNDNNKLFSKGAQNLGLDVKRLKINVKNCHQQGFCNLGCTVGAKQGTLEVQIPKVVKRGVELIANARVSELEENKVHFSIKDAPDGSKPNKYASGEYELSAKYIIVAAGVLNTPAILLRSARKLKISTKNLGRFLTLHPALNVNAVYKEVITNFKGFPKTVYVDDYSESEHFYLETSFYYPGITAKNNPGIGQIHSEIMRDYNKMMSILILIHDDAEADNRISIDKNGNSVIHYRISKKTKQSLIKAIRVATNLFFEAGCTKALIPGSSKWPLYHKDKSNLDKLIHSQALNFNRTPLSSAHPQGGARMGNDPSKAVCDLKGKVYGTKSIYVCDASLFPTSVHVNPYETIMLFSKYIAEQFQIE